MQKMLSQLYMPSSCSNKLLMDYKKKVCRRYSSKQSRAGQRSIGDCQVDRSICNQGMGKVPGDLDRNPSDHHMNFTSSIV